MCFDLSKILVREYLQNPIFIDLPYFGEAYGIIFLEYIYIYIYIIAASRHMDWRRHRGSRNRKERNAEPTQG